MTLKKAVITEKKWLYPFIAYYIMYLFWRTSLPPNIKIPQTTQSSGNMTYSLSMPLTFLQKEYHHPSCH